MIRSIASSKSVLSVVLLVALCATSAVSRELPISVTRMFEWTIESRKAYADPFDDVDIDVIFERDGQSWRVPTFWRGGSRWTVRFAPPSPGTYTYHLESTDRSNPDLNGHDGQVLITPYTGSNE